MHERSLILNLVRKIDNVVKRHNCAKATGVAVRLGALAHISADHFREHFLIDTRGTVAEGAALSINVSDDLDDPYAQDIRLESVELEE